jgi:hypothetical protein
VVPTAQPYLAEQMGESVCVGVELAERHRLTGRLEYERRLVKSVGGMLPGIHARDCTARGSGHALRSRDASRLHDFAVLRTRFHSPAAHVSGPV